MFIRVRIIFSEMIRKNLVSIPIAGVLACTCNPDTLEAEFRNGVSSIPAVGNSPLIGGWIV